MTKIRTSQVKDEGADVQKARPVCVNLASEEGDESIHFFSSDARPWIVAALSTSSSQGRHPVFSRPVPYNTEVHFRDHLSLYLKMQ